MALPSSYQEVEYIQSSGTQWFDTGVKVNSQNRVFKTKFQFLNSSKSCLFGVINTESGVHTRFTRLSNGHEWDCYKGDGYGRVTYSKSYESSEIEELELGNNYIKNLINGQTLASGTVGNYSSDDTMYLFASRQGGSTIANNISSFKLFYFQIIDNGTLVRNYVPCYRKSDLVVGMYDTVNDQFYTNAGSGSFIFGVPVIKAGGVLVGGTSYTMKGGRPLINGTGYEIARGITLNNGTSRVIKFGVEPPSGATAYFPFTSNFSDVISGSAGSSLVGSPTITSGGVFGDNCLYLNGSSALTIPYSSTLDLTTNGTVEFWAKITSNNSTGNNYLFGNPVRSGTFSKGYGLFICNDTAGDSGLRLAYGNGSSEKNVKFADTNAVVDSVWHHWSLNRSGNTITIYKDGVLLSSASVSITLGTTAFMLGKSRDTAKYLTGYFNDLLVVQGRTLRTGNFGVPTSHYEV